MCKSLAQGGQRCTSSHRAVRAAHRVLTPDLRQTVDQAGAGHPAALAYAEAEEWAERTREAVESGDEDAAATCLEHTKDAAARARELADQHDALAGPDRTANVMPAAHETEHGRAATALGRAAGTDQLPIPRQDGGHTVAWSTDGSSGAATVYPEGDDGHPYARLVFTHLDEDRYGALRRSPWPYQASDGWVVYENMPVDQAEQIIATARTGRAGRPWEKHGLDAGEERFRLGRWDADELETESRYWSENLNADEHEWAKAYTDHHYDEINRHLYTGRPMHEDVDGLDTPMSEVAHHLDAAISEADTPSTPHLTYRGYTPPAEVIEYDCVPQWARANFTVGRTYRDLSYVSVSHCPEVAVGFSDNHILTPDNESKRSRHRVVFEVVTSKGAAMASVSEFDNEERERLLPRGANYRVVGIHDDVDVAGKNCVLIQLVDTDEIPRY